MKAAQRSAWVRIAVCLAVGALAAGSVPLRADVDTIRRREQQLKESLDRVSPAVVAITDGLGFGTGVVVSEDGIVLTASHVVLFPSRRYGHGPRQIEVVFPDGKSASCRLLGSNRYCDAAMLQITDPVPEGGYPHVELGRSAQVRRGDWCFALGHPGGLRDDRPAVLRFGRVLSVSDQTIVSDNAIVLGDSGGPLFDLQGRLIGIHSMITRIIVENRHVAIDVWHRDWDRFTAGEEWGELRINEEDPAPTQFIGLGLTWDNYRARVRRVLADSPADAAGLQRGDVILKVNGRTYADRLGLASLLARLKEGEQVRFHVLRDGEQLAIDLTTGTFSDADAETEDDVLTEEDHKMALEFQRQMQFDRPIGTHEKRTRRVMRDYAPLTRPTRGSVVRFESSGRQIALGVVMSADGEILTKASEIQRAQDPVCVLPDGSAHSFRRIGSDITWDLMLVRVDTERLEPIEWSETVPTTATLLVSPDHRGRPMLPGVVEIPVFRLETAQQGFLGVRLQGAWRGMGSRVDSLLEGGAAQRDGIEAGDVILSINGKSVSGDRDLIRRIRGFRPNETISVRVMRGDAIRTVSVTLTPRFVSDSSDVLLSHYRDRDNAGKYASVHSSGFPEVIQHDTDLFPFQCGGPILDLSGKAVGLNIARAARIISYAIPAEAVQKVYRSLRENALADRS